MSRFAIINPKGLLQTDNMVPRSERVIVDAPGLPPTIGLRMLTRPVFMSADARVALKYATREDAAAAMSHPDIEDPQAFAGCDVVECEFDPEDPAAVRAAPAN